MKIQVSETTKEKIDLYRKMIAEEATSHDLMRLSFLRGMISEEEYADYLKIEDFCRASETPNYHNRNKKGVTNVE